MPWPRGSPSRRSGRRQPCGRSRRRARTGRRARRSEGRSQRCASTSRLRSLPMPAAWLVLPTYNEAENLERIVRTSVPELAKATDDHHILVVDDGSPDGTGEIADRLAAELAPVEVLHRTAKEGLGRAYLAGFARALAAGADLVLEMDSDFSHDPADPPRMIAPPDGADLVLGSRYVPGGGVVDWGLARRALSRGGSIYARAMLRVPVRDMTGGFKVFRREVLERLDLAGVHA